MMTVIIQTRVHSAISCLCSCLIMNANWCQSKLFLSRNTRIFLPHTDIPRGSREQCIFNCWRSLQCFVNLARSHDTIQAWKKWEQFLSCTYKHYRSDNKNTWSYIYVLIIQTGLQSDWHFLACHREPGWVLPLGAIRGGSARKGSKLQAESIQKGQDFMSGHR